MNPRARRPERVRQSGVRNWTVTMWMPLRAGFRSYFLGVHRAGKSRSPPMRVGSTAEGLGARRRQRHLTPRRYGLRWSRMSGMRRRTMTVSCSRGVIVKPRAAWSRGWWTRSLTDGSEPNPVMMPVWRSVARSVGSAAHRSAGALARPRCAHRTAAAEQPARVSAPRISEAVRLLLGVPFPDLVLQSAHAQA